MAVKKSLEHRESRLKVGLTENFVDLKDSTKDPGLKFVPSPDIATRN